MGKARALSRASGQTEHFYDDTRYATRRWKRRRRVIIKAEVVRHSSGSRRGAGWRLPSAHLRPMSPLAGRLTKAHFWGRELL